jgi:ApaG protein
MYEQITRAIKITVNPFYLDEQSEPDEGRYVFAYKVRIENCGEETVRLRTRYWQITDGLGHIQEVHGAGVVGEQPTLSPGETFEYTSGTPLSTPSGIMVGRYGMETSAGESFEVDVPAFSLDSPFTVRQLH